MSGGLEPRVEPEQRLPLNEQLGLDLGSPRKLHRTGDPVTSRLAAHGQRRRDIHLFAVLRAYEAGDAITDVEASQRSGLERIETTRRASELRNAHLIAPLYDEKGDLYTAVLPSGRRGMLCRITPEGLLELNTRERHDLAAG